MSILEHSQFILIFESLLLNLTYVSDIDLLFIKNLFFLFHQRTVKKYTFPLKIKNVLNLFNFHNALG
jgi:hypothetical protein